MTTAAYGWVLIGLAAVMVAAVIRMTGDRADGLEAENRELRRRVGELETREGKGRMI